MIGRLGVALIALQMLACATFARTKREQATPQVYYRTVDVDGLSIFYREAGPKDAPTIVLLQ